MTVRARAPLRLGFAGGGSDLSPFCDWFGGCVLNATIDLYAYAHIEAPADNSLRFSALDVQAEFSTAAVSELPLGGPLALHKAVYNRLVREFCNGRPLPVHLMTHCDAPPGSGLGSSSTLVVAMIKAFAEWLHLPLGEYDVARLAFDIERREAGLSGGRQDQYAAAFGGINFMEFHANDRVVVNPLRIEDRILLEFESSIVLYSTGVSRSSSAIIDEQTRNMREPGGASIDALKRLKSDAIAMKEALLKGDLEIFAECMRDSWEAKKLTAHGITTPEIDALFERALGAGALAGKVSGAGGGGFMIFVVEPERRMSVIRALNGTGGNVRPCHFTQRGAEGWQLERPREA